MSSSSPDSTAHIMAQVRYTGNLRCEATHLQSGQSIHTDAPTDNHGLGEAFSPTDLVATALATCILTTISILGANHDIDIEGASAEVIKVMDGPPRRISAVRILIRLPAKPYTPKQRSMIAHIAETCPVARSLHPDLLQEVNILYAGDQELGGQN